MKIGLLKLSYKTVVLFGLFLFLFFILRWNSFTTPFERDEGEYAYSAWIMKQGTLPYENSFMQKPPAIIYTYFLGQIFDPNGVAAPRVLSSLSVLMTTIFIAVITRKEFGKRAGWLSLFLSLPLFLIPYNTPYAANTESFMILPLVALLYLYIKTRSEVTARQLFISGILSALTLLYKPLGLPIILFIYAVWFWEFYKQKLSIKDVAVKLFTVIAGGIVITVGLLLPFIISGKLNYLIESSVIYNLSYTGFEGFTFTNIFNYIGGRYIKVYWPYYLLLLYFLIRRPPRWWYYLGIFLAAVISVYSSPMGHYYILVIPFWVLISAYSLNEIIKNYKLEHRFGKWTGLIIILVILLIVSFPFKVQWGLTPEQLSVWMYGSVNPFIDAKIVGGKVKEMTREDDTVFVAGSEPEIYYYAKRKSPTRFVITYPLNITSKFREEYQSEVVTDLSDNPPTVIVVSNRQHSGLWNEGSPQIFINFLNELLVNDYQIAGIFLWERDKSYWLTQFEKNDLNQASLIVYKKK